MDETGHKDNGDRFWTWVFKAEPYVLFRIDKPRGSQVLIEVLGKAFDGTLGCDHFSAYRKFMKDFHVAVQFCIAHLIRNIRFLTTLPDAPTRPYGEKLLHAVNGLFKVIDRHDILAPNDFRAALEQAIRFIVIDRHVTQGEAPKAGAPTNGYGPLSPPALFRGARPSRSLSRPCRPVSTIAIRPSLLPNPP